MRPRRDPAPTLTRRALAARFAASAAAIGFGNRALASAPPPLDPALRDAALRGLALAGHRGDPVAEQAAEAALARLTAEDPEGALLLRLYRALDVRPSAIYRLDAPAAEAADLGLLHKAIAAGQPVAFSYTDLSGQRSERRVLPFVLVHPPQGVKLLAWCEKAEGYRQFFVREMRRLAGCPGDFRAERLTLLRGLVEKEGA